MKIRAGNIIKHPKFMDVAFLVHAVRGPYGPNKRMNIKGEWVNLGFVKSWPLNLWQVLRMTQDELNMWHICLKPKAECLRETPWKVVL